MEVIMSCVESYDIHLGIWLDRNLFIYFIVGTPINYKSLDIVIK